MSLPPAKGPTPSCGWCPCRPIVAAMPNYRRAFVPGGCWFFTVNLLERRNALRLLRPTACPFRVTNRQLRRPMRRRRLSSLHLSRMPRRPRVSERPDLDLAEPHDAAAVLKRDPPLGELG